MQLSVEKDNPPPRKRRKIEEELSNFCYLTGQDIENKNIGGIGSFLQQSPRRNKFHIDSINQRPIEYNISTLGLSSDSKIIKNHSQAHGQEDIVHTDPHTMKNFVSPQAADIKPPQSTRYSENQQRWEPFVGGRYDWTYRPVWNLQKPPRVHVRSSSAFPESVGIRINKNVYTGTGQFDRRRRGNSQPPLMDAPRNALLHSIVQDMWDSEDVPAEHLGERVPLLRRIQTQSLPGTGTDDGVNEGRQHIGRHKNLWFVAVALLTGIFLCLFLYAFNIIS